MSELDDLKREVAQLKDQLNPPPRQPSTHPRYDTTDGMSMPPISDESDDRCCPFIVNVRPSCRCFQAQSSHRWL